METNNSEELNKQIELLNEIDLIFDDGNNDDSQYNEIIDEFGLDINELLKDGQLQSSYGYSLFHIK